MPEPDCPSNTTETMLAMVLEQVGQPLREMHWPIPVPGEQEVLIRVSACGVCRTDLHIIDGELPSHKMPLIQGHQIVGAVAQKGPGVSGVALGERVGVPWLGGSCHACPYCDRGQENLCDNSVFTGYDKDGGYAQYALVDSRYCFPLPDNYDDVHAAHCCVPA